MCLGLPNPSACLSDPRELFNSQPPPSHILKSRAKGEAWGRSREGEGRGRGAERQGHLTHAASGVHSVHMGGGGWVAPLSPTLCRPQHQKGPSPGSSQGSLAGTAQLQEGGFYWGNNKLKTLNPPARQSNSLMILFLAWNICLNYYWLS